VINLIVIKIEDDIFRGHGGCFVPVLGRKRRRKIPARYRARRDAATGRVTAVAVTAVAVPAASIFITILQNKNTVIISPYCTSQLTNVLKRLKEKKIVFSIYDHSSMLVLSS
jgi:hypothetical protein